VLKYCHFEATKNEKKNYILPKELFLRKFLFLYIFPQQTIAFVVLSYVLKIVSSKLWHEKMVYKLFSDWPVFQLFIKYKTTKWYTA
jgi:hypothetical protein